MGFYFRIPLPGPFGYSKRIGGHKRKRRRSTAYHGYTAAGRQCGHRHRTLAAAQECTRKNGGHKPPSFGERRRAAKASKAARADLLKRLERVAWVNGYSADTQIDAGTYRDFLGLVVKIHPEKDGSTTLSYYACPIAQTAEEDKEERYHAPFLEKKTFAKVPADLKETTVNGGTDVNLGVAVFKATGRGVTVETGWPDWAVERINAWQAEKMRGQREGEEESLTVVIKLALTIPKTKTNGERQ